MDGYREVSSSKLTFLIGENSFTCGRGHPVQVQDRFSGFDTLFGDVLGLEVE